VGYWRALLSSLNWENSRREPFAVGLVVAVPAAQGGVAGVGKEKLQRRRFNVAVAKCHVGFASHGVAKESCPRRQPWVQSSNESSRGAAEEYVRRDSSTAPAGACSILNRKPTADAVGYWRALLRSLNWENSRREPFAMGLVVAVPASQSGVAVVGEKKLQRRRFNMAVAIYCVGFTSYGTAKRKSFHDNRKICGSIVAPYFIPRHAGLVVERRSVEI
jgi:hypothetical protein